MAVASRALCPMMHPCWLHRISASCKCCGKALRENLSKAREKVASCGIFEALFQAQVQRSCRSRRNCSRKRRVVSIRDF
jgi:hypothetical protein